MPDREKFTKAIEYLNWYFTQDDGSADKNAVKAWEVVLLWLLREEQEPVEPKKIFTNPVCGVCDQPLDVTDDYCRHCGRAVKWHA